MKLSTLFLIMIALQFTLMMFGINNYEDTSLFQFILNPTSWATTAIIAAIGVTALGLVATALVGSIIFGKTDTIIFAQVVASLLSFCIPIGGLWNVIYSELGIWGSSIVAAIVASAFTAPLAILAITTVLNWWRTTGEG